MNFKAEKIDLVLNLTGFAEDGQELEKKVFVPKQRVNANFAENILTEWNDYIKAQRELEEENQDSINDGYLNTMSKVYHDLDIAWIKENFSMGKIKEMFDFVIANLSGAKKNA